MIIATRHHLPEGVGKSSPEDEFASPLGAELVRVFAALDEHDIRYCVFRDYDRLTEAKHDKEIDLLVDPHDLDKLRDLLVDMKFVEVPSWGHDPHVFFVAYLRSLGTWLKLDVVTAVCFGKPISALQANFTRNFLDERIQQELAFSPAADSEFLVLLLKCIVNDRAFSESRRTRLSDLLEEIQNDSTMRQRLESSLSDMLGSALPCEDVVRALTGGAEAEVLSRRRKVIWRLFMSQPLSTLGRFIRVFVMKRLRFLLYASFGRGISVAILAPDGAGKSTLADVLARQRPLNARLIYMGDNIKARNIGLPTTAWLHRQKKSPGRNPLVKLLVAVGSFPNRLADQCFRCAIGYFHVLRGRCVIYDRYVYDSWINPPPTRFMKKVRRFLIDRACPTPNVVILLDAPGTTLFARKGEHSPEALEAKRQGYLGLRKSLPNMVVVDASQSATEVQSEVIDLLWQCRGSRDLVSMLNERRS